MWHHSGSPRLQGLLARLAIFLCLWGCSSNLSSVRPPSGGVDSLSASVEFSLTQETGGHLSGRGLFTVVYPDRFRLTILSPFGSVIADLVGDGGEMLFIDHQQKSYIRQRQGDPPLIPFAEALSAIPRVVKPLSPAPCPPGGDLPPFRIVEMEPVQSLCLPRVIDFVGRGGNVRIRLDDLELNPAIEPDSLTPNLGDFHETYGIVPEGR